MQVWVPAWALPVALAAEEVIGLPPPPSLASAPSSPEEAAPATPPLAAGGIPRRAILHRMGGLGPRLILGVQAGERQAQSASAALLRAQPCAVPPDVHDYARVSAHHAGHRPGTGTST